MLYGAAAAVMLASVVLWFSSYNEVMTSDKFVYLFGRVIPALSLVLSMTLRFVPKFKAQFQVVSEAQRCVGRDTSTGSVLQRLKNAITILSIMVTWCLENAIETADSMKSRGYGLPGRTLFSIYRFRRRDGMLLAVMALCGAYTAWGCRSQALAWSFYPRAQGAPLGAFALSVYGAYGLLCALPLLVDLAEELRWAAAGRRAGNG